MAACVKAAGARNRQANDRGMRAQPPVKPAPEPATRSASNPMGMAGGGRRISSPLVYPPTRNAPAAYDSPAFGRHFSVGCGAGATVSGRGIAGRWSSFLGYVQAFFGGDSLKRMRKRPSAYDVVVTLKAPISPVDETCSPMQGQAS